MSSVGKILKLESFSAPNLGTLFVLDQFKLPFLPKRVFFVSRVPKNSKRGQHAHKSCSQIIIVTQGVVEILYDTGKTSEKFILAEGSNAILIPPMVWSTQYTLSLESTICVLASHSYDSDDYINDYSIFKSLAQS
jgi:UDP-2-acetamido-3-amino-2,3-dideoxy-glucuronate N-acetyltransferase